MEKQNHGTKFLCRKSNCTINTRSKTCSGASQFFTRSGILQMKKRLHKTNYYVIDGKVKRDLSIATDKCILRGIYKRKFGKFKCSGNAPDVGANIESKCDRNSWGDSAIEEQNVYTRLNMDVTSLVLENLKDLLRDWIKKYLLNNLLNNDKKIDTILDSILHNVELKRTESSYTYTLDTKVDENCHFNSKNKHAGKIDTCAKPSCQTVPVTGKHAKLISTLSIPRKLKRHGSASSQQQKPTTRKIRYKNVFLTISRSSTFLLNSSSFNLLSISTKSFIKRCAIYDNDEIKPCKKHEVVELPKSSYSASMPDTRQNKLDSDLESKVYPNALEMEPIQSLVKSIYADDPANITSTDKNIANYRHDNFTMTDTDGTLKDATPTFNCHKLNWKKANHDETAEESLNMKKRRKKNTRCKPLSPGSKIRKTISMKKQMQSFKCLNKRTTDTSNTYRKTNYNQNENNENFLKELQGILKHFVHYTDSKNIKFDVKINIFPGVENTLHDETINDDAKRNTLHNGNLTAAYNVVSNQILPESKMSNQVTQNQNVSSNSSRESEPKLISILDGAFSQSKYVISKDKSQESSDKNIKNDSEKTNIYNNSGKLEIAQDINELRIIIRDLAITTENFVKEHMKRKPCGLDIKEKTNNVANNINKDSLGKSTISKAVQYSNNKNLIMSGLKLKKEPKKKDIQEYITRLGKKSISYNVIESESILKVTDMTSTAADLSTDVKRNETMKYPLPKSKSLFEVGRSKRKLLAYYCDELVKSRQFMQNCNKCYPPNAYKYSRCPHENNNCSQFVNEKRCNENNEIVCEDHQQYTCDEEDCEISGPGYSCSSVYIDVENRKKIAVRSRGSMTFWEGLFYCILLWIPVLVIFWLIYVYVIKDIIQPVNPALRRRELASKRASNHSLFHITLSDLGF